MACEININDIQLTGLTPISIEVSGTALNCDMVLVTLSCIDATDGPFIDVTAAVTGGNWTAVFSDTSEARCSCQQTTSISAFASASCATDPGCAPPAPFKKELKCDLCPTVSLSEPELTPSAECNADGTVSVTLRAQVINNNAAPAIVHIECGPNGTPTPSTTVYPVSPGQSLLISQVCRYPSPITPAPWVNIDLPSGCPAVSIDVQHQICCPDPAIITTTIGNCVNGIRQVTFDLGGNFTGSIDYGDGSPNQSFSGSLLSHNYAVPPNSYTATLEVEFCNDIQIPVNGLNPCRQSGACCLTDGSCVVIEDGACQQQGGVYQGDGVSCMGLQCSPTGACCLPGGNCAQHSQADCDTLSGSYHGDQTDCADIDQIGACCLPGGSCTELTQCNCLSRDGEFLGIGSNCANDNPEGACCLPDDSCKTSSRCTCEDQGGRFRGAGSACDEVECVPDGNSCFSSISAFFCCILSTLLFLLFLAFIAQVVLAFCPFPPNTTLIVSAGVTLAAILLLLILLAVCSWSFCRILRALIWLFEWTAIAAVVAFFVCTNAVLLLVAFGFGVLAGLLLLIRPSCGWPKLLRLP